MSSVKTKKKKSLEKLGANPEMASWFLHTGGISIEDPFTSPFLRGLASS